MTVDTQIENNTITTTTTTAAAAAAADTKDAAVADTTIAPSVRSQSTASDKSWDAQSTTTESVETVETSSAQPTPDSQSEQQQPARRRDRGLTITQKDVPSTESNPEAQQQEDDKLDDQESINDTTDWGKS